MKIIVPMAGMGKRLRPHTLTTPKPLLPVAGKPIVQRLVEDIVAVSEQKIDEIAYIIGHFGEETEKNLIAIAEKLGAKGTLHYQEEALGTAHAILCAKSALTGPVTVAFADTLFKADFSLNTSGDGVLWVQKIQDPRQFGVVTMDAAGTITGFVEKPQTFVSDLAMIGIYYFNDGEWLKRELQYLIDHHIQHAGEYQLPDALRNMVKQGGRFFPGTVKDWMDCGNQEAVIETNQKLLWEHKEKNILSTTLKNEKSHIIPPCFIGENVLLKNARIGPCVSIGDGTIIEDSTIKNTLIFQQSEIKHSDIDQSIIGHHTRIHHFKGKLSLGDYSLIH